MPHHARKLSALYTEQARIAEGPDPDGLTTADIRSRITDARCDRAAARLRHDRRRMHRQWAKGTRRQRRDRNRMAAHIVREILREEGVPPRLVGFEIPI